MAATYALTLVIMVGTLVWPGAAPVAALTVPGTDLEPVTVELTDSGFLPETITAAVGQNIWIDNASSGPRAITVGGGSLTSGPIPIGGRFVFALPTGGSFDVTDDAPTPHTATLNVGRTSLAGAVTDNAGSRIPKLLPPTAPLDLHPDLAVEFSRNRILISPVFNATVGQINEALTANRLVVVGGLNKGFGDVQILVTEVIGGATPSDTDQLQEILDDLRSRPAIRTAALDMALVVESALPRPLDPEIDALGPLAYSTWDALVATDGSARGVGENYGLEASRFPQAWNLRDEMRRRSPSGPAFDTVVMDVGFDLTHPAVATATLHRICSDGIFDAISGQVCTENPIDRATGRPESRHGNSVAATIGASFEQGPAGSRTFRGVVGGNPEADLHLVPWFAPSATATSTPSVTFFDFSLMLTMVLDARPTRFPQLKVINISGGSVTIDPAGWDRRWAMETCGPSDRDDSDPGAQRVACTPNTLDRYLAEFRAMAETMRPVVERVLGIGAVIVVSAGNEAQDFCTDVPPRTVACENFDRPDAFNQQSMAWVDRTWHRPSGRGSPVLMPEAYDETNRIASYSNFGTIAAPGTVVSTEVLPSGTPTYGSINGTSFAAPLTSAAVGLLAELNPTMQGDAIVAHLKQRGRSDIAGTVTPRLDVFEAALSLPGVAARLVDVNDASLDGNRRTVRLDDGTVLFNDTTRSASATGSRWSAPDGRVDMRDFRVFRDAWLDGCRSGGAIVSASCPPGAAIVLDGGNFHPKFDTNLDGCINFDGLAKCDRPETLFSRLDFNGDGTLDDRQVVVPLTQNGAVANPGEGRLMTDLDVLASQWGRGVGADTGGYDAADLPNLLSSADIELRLERLWAAGATSATVEAVSIATLDELWQETFTKPLAGQSTWNVITLPVWPSVDPSLVQVRITTTLPPRADPVVYLSDPLEARPGEDLTVVPCADRLTVMAIPSVPAPGETSRLEAQLVDCFGAPVADQDLTFDIVDALDSSTLGGEVFVDGLVAPVIERVTDVQGRASVDFTFPPRQVGPAAVRVSTNPGIGALAPMRATARFGGEFDFARGLTVFYRSREVIEEYERLSSNDWADDVDDCDGPIDAAGSPAGCFSSLQRLAFPDSIGEEAGVIMIDRRGRVEVEDGLAWDSLRVIGGLEADEYDPSVHYAFVPLVTNLLEWPAGNLAAATDREIFSAIDITTPGSPSYEWSSEYPIQVPNITYTLNASGLDVFGLAAINDDTYWQGTTHSVVNTTGPFHPDVPVGRYSQFGNDHRHQIPTELAVLNRIDGTSFPFAGNVDGPLTVRRSPNGNFLTYTYCARNDRNLAGGGGYWSDDDPLEPWGRNPDDQRFEREPGDRAAPRHSGFVRGKSIFVATVSLDGTAPPEGTLALPECDPPGGDASFTVSAGPQEGRVVRFTPAVSRTAGDDRLEYKWMFGDGNTSTERSPEHVYDDSGEYIVTLTVTDPEGGVGISSKQITVANTPPNLWIEAARVNGTSLEFDIRLGEFSAVDGLGITVSVIGSSGFPVVPATPYPIGDHTITVPNVNPGAYTISIFAIDKDGASASRTLQLTVSSATPTGGAIQPLMSPLVSPLMAPATLDEEPTQPLGFRSAATTLSAQTAASTVDPLASVAIPAFVLSGLDATTAIPVQIRNASINNGAPVGTVFDLGDGRTAVPITAGATASISYLAAGEPEVRTTLAGLSVGTRLRVTGTPVVPVVAYLGVTTGFVGQEVEVSARVTATTGTGDPVAGRPVIFSIPGASVTAVTGSDGLATTRLRVPAPAGATTLTVDVPAAGDDPGTSTTAAFVVQANDPPTVNAGGPYTVSLDGVLSLQATGDDPDDGPAVLGFTWDLDGDGEFDDATGASALVTNAMLTTLVCGGACTGGQSYPIAVRVTDPKGATAVATTTVTTIADFALTITPATATLVPNSQTSFTVGVVTTNGFNRPVTLTAPSLPPDVTASFSPSTVTPNGTSVLTLRAGVNVQAATSPLIVRGTADGIVRETGGSVSLEFGLLPVCYGTITGVVRDADTGEPLAGFPVAIPSLSRSMATDDQGNYRFEQLAVAGDNGPRFYELRFGTSGTAFETRFRSGVAACNVVTTLDTDVTRLRFGTITGRVFLADPTGAIIGPLPNVTVTGPAGPATDAEGRYTKQNVPLNSGGTPRTYLIGVSGVANVRHPAVTTSVTARADSVTEQDLVSQQICFGSVRGRMIDDATGLAIPFARMVVSGRTITANAQGVAVMTNVPLAAPDNRLASLGVIGRPPTGTTLFRDPTPAILPRCGAVTPVDVPVTMPVENFATVAATIVDAETGEPVQGLQLGTANGARSPMASNAQGRVDWRVSLGLNNTTGNISVFAAAGNGYFSSATQGLALTANGTQEVTLRVLRARFGAIEGRVTDALTGAALEGITVLNGPTRTTTDADGRYRFDDVGLQAGNLPTINQITARDNFNVFEPIGYWFQTKPVTVVADQTSTADFALVPVCQGANVRGRVINAATGEPLEGALVGTGTDSRLTDIEGRFSFTNIRVGVQNAPTTITVSASKTGFTSASRQVTLFCGADIVVDFGTSDVNAGTIDGRVTDESGTPIAGVFVGAEFGGAAVTGTDGRYSILSVPVNSNGTSRDWGLTFIPAFGSGFESTTRTASVRSGTVTTVNAVLLTGSGVPNQSPTARITGASTATEGSTVTLSATTSSDPDGTIALFEWDLGADGTFDVSGADATTFDVTRPDDGTVSVRLRVTDDEGATSTTTFAVTFTNVAPTIALADDLVTDGVRITRGGSFVDPGTADTHDATVDWGAGAGPQPLALTGTAFALDHTYSSGGTYTIVVEVCDDDASDTVDGCGTATFDVTVTMPNRPPTATSASVATRLERPVPIVLAGVDPDGDDLTFTVVTPPAHGALTGAAPNLVYTPGDGYLGDDRFTFTVSDGESTSGPAEIAIRVTAANVAPTATITGPTTAPEGSTITLSAITSSDPDGTIVAYEWDVDDDGNVDGTGTTMPVTLADDGSVVVRLSVTDNEGLVGTTTATVTFANVAPTVTLAADLVVGADRRVTRAGSFTDPGTSDTHTATVDWGEGAGPEELVLTGTTFALDHTFAEPGTYTVTVEICDDDDSDTVDGCGSAQFAITIEPPRVNVPPTAVVTGSFTALEGSTVSLSGTASTDPDGSIVRYDWDLDGDGIFERSGPTVGVSLPDQGEVTVTLRVTDDDGASHTTTRTVTFTDVPPLVVLADDLVAGTDGSVTRTGSVVDPGVVDGHTVTVDWGDGSGARPVTLTDRRFTLGHTYPTRSTFALGLGSSYLVTVEACDAVDPGACGRSVFTVDIPVAAVPADLAVSVSVSAGLGVGRSGTVTLDVSNAGPAPAVGVQVVLVLPDGVTAASSTPPGWSCSVLWLTVTCVPTSDQLVVGNWSLGVPITVTERAPDRLSFVATISSATSDPVLSNNQGGQDVVLQQPAIVPPATTPVPPATTPVPPATTPVPPATTPVLSGTLPETGSDAGRLIQSAMAVSALGLLLVLSGRMRRRRHAPST